MTEGGNMPSDDRCAGNPKLATLDAMTLNI